VSSAAAARVEARKLAAFLRRDLLQALSYRAAFVSDIVNVVIQVIVFGFVSKLIDASALPTVDGSWISYIEFAVVGILVSSFLQLGIGRVSTAVRTEQLMGTLEPLLATPTSLTVVQLGWVAYDLVYVPVRTIAFLLAVSIVADVSFNPGGVPATLVLLLVFLPFVWGLGVLGAATTITFRRGVGVVGLVTTLLSVTSGAYFPVTVLPSWLQRFAERNPLTMTIDTARELLLGGSAGWNEVWQTVAILVPASILTLTVGVAAFGLALRRERRLGTTGSY